jgi:hypothetical protein
VAARALVEEVFPRGAGSAALDGGVFQTRALAHEEEEAGGAGGAGATVALREGGSAVFVVRVGSALAAGAEVPMARAFTLMKQRAAEANITSWAIEVRAAAGCWLAALQRSRTPAPLTTPTPHFSTLAPLLPFFAQAQTLDAVFARVVRHYKK